jgi:hypothetical protein
MKTEQKTLSRAAANNPHLSSAIYHLERSVGLAAMAGLGGKGRLMAAYADLRHALQAEVQALAAANITAKPETLY